MKTGTDLGVWASGWIVGVAMAVVWVATGEVVMGAGDWGLSGPSLVYSVRDGAVWIGEVRLTGDLNAGLPTTGPTQMQIDFRCGAGEIHLDCGDESGVQAGQRERLGPGALRVVAPPEAFVRTFERGGLIYVAGDGPMSSMDVITIDAVSSRGGTSTVTIPVERRESPWSAWQSEHFPAGELADPEREGSHWGMQAAPAKDGVSNLVKFFLGRGPFDSVVDRLPGVGVDGAGRLTLAVECRREVPGLSAEAEWTLDAATWHSGPGDFGVGPRQTVAEVSELTRFVVTAAGSVPGESRGLARVKVSLGPPPAVPPVPPAPPLSPALVAQSQSQLAAMQLVPGNPAQASVAERAAAREALRQGQGVTYGELAQSMALPADCAVVTSVLSSGNDGRVLQGIAGEMDPGEMFSAGFADIEGVHRSVSWEWVVDQGVNRLVFRSPYNDRFVFRMTYRDGAGVARSATLTCPGSRDEQGVAVAEDECTRPYHGYPRILVSGISMERFAAGGTHPDDLTALITVAIAGMGGVPRVEVQGSASQTSEGGPGFFFAEISAQKMDICRAELMARLQIVAGQLGATVVREGNIFRIRGPDANGSQPNRFRGLWADE